MIRWNNDYNHGAHPALLEALRATNDNSYGGYGLDECCERAAALIRARIGREDADVHFLIGGTQVNYTVIAAALRPYQSVISADSGHINVHETGAVENTGHKIQALPAVNGKISAAQIAAEADAYRHSDVQEHITQPKFVFLSFPTEYGTIYTRRELEEIRTVCDEYGLYMYLDGARLGYGLGSPECDLTLPELAALADAFYIGGTKCGALFGEAVVLCNEALKDHFRSYIKQNGAMLAKGWLLGLQFEALMQDGLYFAITRRAVEQAMRLRAAFAARGIPAYIDSPTNQQFVLLTEAQAQALARGHIYETQFRAPDGRLCVRFCTSWSTRDEDVDALIADIEKL